MPPKIVIDTNVFVSALRSQGGASYRLLSLVPRGAFRIALSVPLVLEYESATKRQGLLAPSLVDDILDRLCLFADLYTIFFLWRPYLRDPGDDLVLELAVRARSDFIVTYNTRDFEGIERFGLSVLNPKEFLERLGALP
jgi:putative PIN family toxin of toxin-antitoxin system